MKGDRAENGKGQYTPRPDVIKKLLGYWETRCWHTYVTCRVQRRNGEGWLYRMEIEEATGKRVISLSTTNRIIRDEQGYGKILKPINDMIVWREKITCTA